MTVLFSSGFEIIPGYAELKCQNTTLSAAEVIASNNVVISAPGSGISIIPVGIYLYLPAGTAFTGSSDMKFIYSGTSDSVTTWLSGGSFLTSASEQRRWACQIGLGESGVDGSFLVADNTAVVLTGGASGGGTGRSLYIRAFYRTVPWAL